MAIKTVNDQGGLLTWRQSFVRIISACLLPALCALLGRFYMAQSLPFW